MRIVCHRQRYARLAVNFKKSLRRAFFGVQAVILNFKIKAVLAEELG